MRIATNYKKFFTTAITVNNIVIVMTNMSNNRHS